METHKSSGKINKKKLIYVTNTHINFRRHSKTRSEYNTKYSENQLLKLEIMKLFWLKDF